jgi:hypothetical protein
VVSVKTTVALGLTGLVVAAASACGPGGNSNSLRTTAGDSGSSVATVSPSAPVTTTTPRTRVTPRPVAPTRATPRAPAPAPKPVVKPKPAAPKPVARSTCGAPANPWGYNFCGRGSHIFSPAADVCAYFNCIASFDNGTGYMVQCNDGMYSMSGSRRGACSYHSGEGRAVYGGP